MHNYRIHERSLRSILRGIDFAPHTRKMLRRVFVQGMPYEQAGRPWGMSKQYAWKRVHRVLDEAHNRKIDYMRTE